MRKLLYLLCLLVFTSSLAFSNPFYDANKEVITYDQEQYNIKLRNKLEDDYRKKCFVQVSPTMSKQICDEFSYNKYVEIPYIYQKKNFN